MRYTNNAIYSKIRESALSAVSTAYVTETYTPKPSKFPTVFAREIGHFTPQPTQVFTNTQDIYESTWEVQVMSNLQTGKKEQAYLLMDAVKTALRPLYFIETFEQPLDTTNNGGIYTLVARFRRIIGSGESMPTS